MELEAELKGLLSDSLDSEVSDVEMKDGNENDACGDILDDGGSDVCLHSDVKSLTLCGSTVNSSRKKARTEMVEVNVDSEGNEKSCFEFVDCPMNSSDVSIPCSKDSMSLQKSTSVSQEGIVCGKYNLKCEEVESSERKKSDDDNEEANQSFSNKRKRDSLWTMLCWVTGVAKDPCDPEVGSLPERSKWKYFGNEYWKQILLAREAIFSKQHMDTGADQLSWQRNQRMHPSMYDDHGSGYKVKLRCRESLFSKKKASDEGASLSGTGNKKYLDKHSSGSSELTTAEIIFDDPAERQVPLGRDYQVVVPEWSGMVFESEPKWLGTKVWPPEEIKRKHVIERVDPIGNERQNSCSCQFPGSSECFRFHIAQKRLKLRLELGSVFFIWKFDKMGEEVGLSWTKDEGKKFKTLVELNPPSLQVSFWGEIFEAFPTKSREELLSYYFNVFLLKRRGYQNRVTPANINSDDDDESVWEME